MNTKLEKQSKVREEKETVIQNLKGDKLNLLKIIDDVKTNYCDLKGNTQGFKDILDKLIIKLINIKTEMNQIKKENQNLLFDKERLSMRAAVGFENLTPRPDYNVMLKERDIEIFTPNGNDGKNSNFGIHNQEIKISSNGF